MQWEPFFEDLEGQLAAEWAAERAALDSEAERLRISRIALVDRLRALAGGEPVRIESEDGDAVTGRITVAGVDWIGLDAESPRNSAFLVPVSAISAIVVIEEELLRSARAPQESGGGLAGRMPLGFVLRDLSRRRIPVRLSIGGGRMLSGTIDRAAADHLDIALHDSGEPRRRGSVAGFRVVPLTALRWVGVDGPLRT